MQPEHLIARLADVRRDLHALAEPSGHEKRTAEYLSGLLRDCDPDRLLEGLGGHGVVVEFMGREPGPRVGLRAELDGLANAQGARHGCGHDGHMALLCGVALSLAAKRPDRGSVMLLFQPAEETGQGAVAMLSDCRWAEIAPDLIFALHNLPGLPLGQVALKSGVMNFASVGLKARLMGMASHAAQPEMGHSPAPALARLLVELPGLAGNSELLTLTHVSLGDLSFGTAPGEALLCATLRATGDEGLTSLKNKAERQIASLASAQNLTCDLQWLEPFAATVTHPRAVEMVRGAAFACGLDLFEPEEAFRWSEDFGCFTKAIPGALFCLGAGREQPALHAVDYEFPDELLEAGLRLWLAVLEQAQRGGQ
jgi:amidohydrolase